MRKIVYWLIIAIALLATAFLIIRGRVAHRPAQEAALNPQVVGETDAATLDLGRKAFYEETFGNELALTDLLGLISGPVTMQSFAEAIAKLAGQGTTNLQVRLTKSADIGGRHFSEGQIIDTGLDVAQGAVMPLGVVAVKDLGGKVRAGISCALCHSTVHRQTFQVVHGAPNNDLRAGLIIALATNSASFFAHTDVDLKSIKAGGEVVGSTGERLPLADAAELERLVDAALLCWPPGTFDSMVDMAGNPTRFPTSFTREAYPYGWSGFAAVGPFHGLSSLNNNVHGLNSDPTVLAEAAPTLLNIDKELYLALLLQNAAAESMRFDPNKGEQPSEFFAKVKPSKISPALNHTVPAPTYPKGSLISPDGLLTSVPGAKVWEHINAISAWQNSLVPPAPTVTATPEQLVKGQEVFARAQCGVCHTGPAGTNHEIIPVEQIGTEPVRAKALRATEGLMAPAQVWAFDQPVPLPPNARTTMVPVSEDDERRAQVAFAWGGSEGGYKVPALVGLEWRAPYLHEGGVAVGPDESKDLGTPGTLLRNVPADPAKSLKALLDRRLREKVVAANKADAAVQRMNVQGTGHAFWVDAEAGFAEEEQRDLILYLLHFQPPWAASK